MSSRFVTGGSLDAPIERDDAWLKAQQELEANRAAKAEEAARNADGKSLYEILEANKGGFSVALITCFAAKLKNQYRSLDEDEVEFLDSITESTRAAEASIKKETAEQLAAFRKHQEEVERAALAAPRGSTPGGDEVWVASGKKRKKNTKEKEILKGVKVRKTSSAGEVKEVKKAERDKAGVKEAVIAPVKEEKDSVKTTAPSKPPISPAATKSSVSPPFGLGLAGYSSDEDD
ncbi:hypothetical protein EJ08DRAFT_703005 [Tothia fuscella]|uniref:FAM192A/Fyv6 N-terminal domain-containing protein n=1 Tax=Tothia fuscella TaxID=1048955 RepID=A0A9P4NF74_9PEZI|nr:hypothetical protein EJ08DRAFT_703005 [Tothia fuscella]